MHAWTEPALREWIVGLLALDIGVEIANSETTDNLISVFAAGRLANAAIARFFMPGAGAGAGAGAGQGFGAAFRAPLPDARPTVCAAAYVYCDGEQRLESEFIFVAGATKEPIVQIGLDGLRERTFDAAHIERALGAISGQVEREHADAARAVVREALLECRAVMDDARSC